jgi:hypothetical protein
MKHKNANITINNFISSFTNKYVFARFFLTLRVVLIETDETGQDQRSFTLYTGIT